MKKFPNIFFISTLFLFCLLSADYASAEDNQSSQASVVEMTTMPAGAGEALFNTTENATANNQGTVPITAPQNYYPVTVRLNVPVSLSGLPAEITTTGVACTVRIPGAAGTKKDVFGRARDGNRTMIVNVPVMVPFDRVARDDIHGTYTCHLLLRIGNEAPISRGHIKETVELDPAVSSAEQIFTVRGSF